MASLYKDTGIVKQGKYKGLNYLIYNYKTHPCCYVEIPEYHKLYVCEDFDDPELELIDCHGGITFARFEDFGVGRKFYIGWDFAHFNDYLNDDWLIKANIPEKFIPKGRKKWTQKELIQECKNVIEQIV